jgi:hypothetical protein
MAQGEARNSLALSALSTLALCTRSESDHLLPRDDERVRDGHLFVRSICALVSSLPLKVG